MTENAAIKLLIVDDHVVVREGLKQIIGGTQDMAVIGEAETGFEAIKLSRQLEYHIMLLEIALPDRNGIEVLKQIKKESPHISVIMFSGHREDQYAVRALKSGASGYLNKQCSAAQIILAIKQVKSGLKYISPALAQEMANNLNQEFEGQLHKTLSDREFQTLTMIASGKSVSQIAGDMALSIKTISTYRARALEKMGMRTNAELTRYAIQNHLVD